jgi:hypothetical protein
MKPIVQRHRPEPTNTTENKPIPAPQGESSPADLVGGAGLHGGPAQHAGGAEPRAEHL